MKIIASPHMPMSNGHYSQCISHQGLLYLSGQLPIDPDTKNIPMSIDAQAQQALRNVECILMAAGSSKEQVLQVRVYVSDIAYWDTIDRIYSTFFGDHKPVRSIIPTGALHFGCLLELEVTAIVP